MEIGVSRLVGVFVVAVIAASGCSSGGDGAVVRSGEPRTQTPTPSAEPTVEPSPRPTEVTVEPTVAPSTPTPVESLQGSEFSSGLSTSVVLTAEQGALLWPSVVVPSDGHAFIAAYEAHFRERGVQASLEGSLRLSRCDDPLCASFTETSRDEPDLNSGLSLTIGPDGLPVLGYSRLARELDEQEPRGSASLLSCLDPACAELIETVISDVQSASVAVTPDGVVYVAATRMFEGLDVGVPGFPIYMCETSTCAEGMSVVEVDGSELIVFPQMAMGLDGLPFIAVATQSEVMVLECLDSACTTTEQTVLEDFGDPTKASLSADFPRVASGENGPAAIVYQLQPTGPGISVIGPILVTWDDSLSRRNQVILDSDVISGPPAAITIGPSGLPVVAWTRRPKAAPQGHTELVVARCDDRSCLTGTRATVARGLPFLREVDVALDPAGRPVLVLIANQGDTSGIVLAQCSDTACIEGAFEVTDWGR
jgi:hypothetical protein